MNTGDVGNGDRCEITAGVHQGRRGTVQDRNTSKSGNVTITVREDNGERVKTLARNVRKI